MLECPSCHKKVDHQGENKWFQCPSCRNWICLMVNQNGLAYFELGIIGDNGVIQPVRIIRNRGQRQIEKVDSKPTEMPPPDVRRMDFPTIQKELERVKTRLKALDSNIQGIIDQKRKIPMEDSFRHQSDALLETFRQERKQLKKYKQLLANKEAEFLQDESESAQPASNSSNGMGCLTVVVINAIVAGIGIYVFTRFAGFYLNLQAYLILALVAFVSALISSVIAQFA